MLVFAREHRLAPSRRTVPAGRLIAQLRNIGEDDHDLVVRDAAGRVRATTGVVRPGGLGRLTVRLAAGRYDLVCTVGGHEALGMRVAIRVTRR
ncbi:MAG: hypothetical protein MUE51_02855 [Thermoleophilia bacterium]|jgi:uncharacterized cupredoxin-like copper-binding protein|nr:hypothetical protein [Thermoleophilia bacterium]